VSTESSRVLGDPQWCRQPSLQRPTEIHTVGTAAAGVGPARSSGGSEVMLVERRGRTSRMFLSTRRAAA